MSYYAMLILTSVIVPMLLFMSTAGVVQSGQQSSLAVLIEYIVAGSRDALHEETTDESIYVKQMLGRFYKRRDFQPAWIDRNRLTDKADVVIETIKKVDSQGLVPEYYHLEAISDLMVIEKDDDAGPEDLAMLDVLLTDAFLMLGCHFSAGCINPVTVESEWFLDRTDLAIDIVLEDALNENNLNESLRVLLPPQDDYFRLMNRLNQHREIAVGGWTKISSKKILKIGDSGQSVAMLKERLAELGDLKYPGDESIYDEDVERAVNSFQERHGLDADGIVGPATFNALNVPVDQRVKQIEVNLERMRWASRSLGHRYIIVNIADYNLSLIENNKTVMSMEVVVGRPYWDTPVFSEKMLYLVFNPSWKVPTSIVRREILPKIKKSPEYLTEQGLKVVSGWADDAEEISPAVINWDEAFRYKMRQAPGPLNPLGRVKFMMPNRFNIYLHDTPAKELFSKKSRAFSHGCIRIKYPVELVQYLLKDDPDWTREDIEDAIKKGEELKVKLMNPINVHILYLTSWVDDKGVLHFRNDIYSRDERLYQALKNIP